MMMSDDKKKKAAMIIAEFKSPSKPMKPEMPAEDETDDSVGMDAAAEELMAAIEKKDVKALKVAFKSMMDMCSYKSDEGSDD